MKITIPYITGDGVGREIMPAMQQVVDTVIKYTYNNRQIDWLPLMAGEEAFLQCGSYLPSSTLDTIKKYKIAIKGPLMTPVGTGIRSLNVALRQELDLFVCQRPVRWFRGVSSPVKHPEKVNMTIFRENTEDIYSGIEWEAGSNESVKFYKFLKEEMGVNKVRFPKTSAFGVKAVSIEGTERLIIAACQYALDNHLTHVTLVHKGNIMKYTEGGFKRWGYDVAQRYFGHEIANGQLIINDCIADAFLQNAILKPEDYQVIATLNLNGDYISDMLAAQVGGIGIAPGANINYTTKTAIFEATHGTAPDIAGKNLANPSSLLLSASMLMDFIGWREASQKIILTLETVLSDGYATFDLAHTMPNGKILSTQEFANKLCEYCMEL